MTAKFSKGRAYGTNVIYMESKGPLITLIRKEENKMKPVWLLLISAISASLGQILFKKGVLIAGEVTFKSSIIGELIKLIFNPIVFLGLIFYVVSTILWLIALSKATLNFVYPFTILTFALVMLSSKIIFLEHTPPLRYFGIGLIILGILLSSLAKS